MATDASKTCAQTNRQMRTMMVDRLHRRPQQAEANGKSHENVQHVPVQVCCLWHEDIVIKTHGVSETRNTFTSMAGQIKVQVLFIA